MTKAAFPLRMDEMCAVMRIADVLPKRRDPLKRISPDAELKSVIGQLAVESCGALAVGPAKGPVAGLLTERCAVDAFRRYCDFALHHKASEVMNTRPLVCFVEDAPSEVLERMQRERASHALVFDGAEPVAILTLSGLLAHELREAKLETGSLRRFIAA